MQARAGRQFRAMGRDRLHRQVVSDMDYDAQYAAGLLALQMFGVLQ
jgi:hypothetical protein